ncbi:MAG TPA: hypothetical protein VH277_18005 [Gemmatimonadaceae bacterium]|jgi:hypothetical protein|nr:hypothetical protein [Gemmatimonadaceae bacterium]
MSENDPREPQRYGQIIVVGGGCYGGYYVRQLDRAARAGAVVAERLLVVDRAAECAVAPALASVAMDARLVVRDWRAFFDEYLTTAADAPAAHAHDAIVPSPLMPHLMGDWLVERARRRFGDGVTRRPFDQVPRVPWDRAGTDGTHYVSFATWTCPINCIEPRTCPHTRDERTWSLPTRIADHAREVGERGGHVEVATLHCRHRAYGVGMFDTAEVLEADARIREAGDRGTADVIIGTVSHCHGALTRLIIGERGDSPVG